MTYFPDVNVWIAMYSPGHIHHPAAVSWFDSSKEDRIAFCRITQMGFLRLLTNRHVMGTNVLTPATSWQAFDGLLRNTRIFFAEEPAGLDHRWRASTMQQQGGSNWWTDSYLASFAAAAGLTLVTFDAQLASRRNVHTKLLK